MNTRTKLRLLSGLVTLFAAAGAWTFGTRTGRAIARARRGAVSRAAAAPLEAPDIEDAVEVGP